MDTFRIVLRLTAPLIMCIGGLHLVLGPGADVSLGAMIPPSVMNDAVLDSQNRFYGVAFALYGVLLWICAADVPRYQTILRAVFWVFFAAGLSRFVSIAVHGLPTQIVLVLTALELVPPLIMVWWMSRLPLTEEINPRPAR